jgi:uncharacterized alkaline shock family protein YloU
MNHHMCASFSYYPANGGRHETRGIRRPDDTYVVAVGWRPEEGGFMTAQPNEKAEKEQVTGQSPTGSARGPASGRGGGELVGEQGRTTIADAVVAKIVGVATREVPGVYAMGAGLARAFGAVRERLPGGTDQSVTQGVTVEVGERQAAIDLDVIVEYGVSIPDLAAGIRRSVIGAVEKMCGLEVTEINVTVGDIHLPGEQADEQSESRVQ